MINNQNIRDSKDVYYKNYDNLPRFISYFHQIDLIKQLNPKDILEVGIGNKTVSNYLTQHDFNVKTCDINKTLEPDYTGDIRKLPFKSNLFDLILACEILEHLPWQDFEKSLNELYRVTRKYLIISIPYSSITLELIISIPIIRKILKINFPVIDLFIRVPLIFLKKSFDGYHYWEMGRKKHSIRKIRNVLKRKFDIIKEVRPILNPYHYFFVLKKRNNKSSKSPS